MFYGGSACKATERSVASQLSESNPGLSTQRLPLRLKSKKYCSIMCHFGYLPQQLVCTLHSMFAAISVLLAGVELAAMANMFPSKARAMNTRHFKTKARALMTEALAESLARLQDSECKARRFASQERKAQPRRRQVSRAGPEV